jgi:hypothetical protein
MSGSVQLAFPFIGDNPPHPGQSRTTTYWHRRIDRAIRRAYELGRRQAQRRPVDITPPLPVRTAYPNGDDRNELAVLARRVARLTVSHKAPEKFFEDKSELAHAQIARRA